MKIADILSESCFIAPLRAQEKESVIRELAETLHRAGKVGELPPFVEAVLNREKEFSTGIGMGLAIPHGRAATVNGSAVAVGIAPEGIDFAALDNAPVHLVFLIATPENADKAHLEVLAELSRRLMHEETRNALKKSASFKDILAAFGEA